MSNRAWSTFAASAASVAGAVTLFMHKQRRRQLAPGTESHSGAYLLLVLVRQAELSDLIIGREPVSPERVTSVLHEVRSMSANNPLMTLAAVLVVLASLENAAAKSESSQPTGSQCAVQLWPAAPRDHAAEPPTTTPEQAITRKQSIAPARPVPMLSPNARLRVAFFRSTPGGLPPIMDFRGTRGVSRPL